MIANLSPFVRKVILRNYKNIEACDVVLHPLAILVGPNGTGKSNFLDALKFVAESLRDTPDHALRGRGGIGEVRRRSRGHPTHFRIELDLTLAEGVDAHYSFRVGAAKKGGFEMQEESCQIDNCGARSHYRIERGRVKSASFDPKPPASRDRLYLGTAAAYPEFRVLYDSLCGMGFYNPNPSIIRGLQDPDSGQLLASDGRNLASVLYQLEQRVPQAKKRVEQYLGHIVNGLTGVERKTLGHKETLEFRQTVAGDEDPWRFSANNMSDGTLRALGVLAALFQCFDRPVSSPIPLIGIEEPEVALHPAATAVLMDALHEASHFTQVLVTSHSPDLLDAGEVDSDSLVIVDSDNGNAVFGPADDASISAMKDKLYTPGELLKLDQLKPQPAPAPGADSEFKKPKTRSLFEDAD